MELTCPECGRAYEIPEHTTQRLFKCMCKFTFRVESARGGAKPKKREVAETFTAKNEEVGFTEDSKGVISDHDISQFANNLRKKLPFLEEPSEVKGNKPAPSAPPTNFHQSIDVDENRITKKKEEREAKQKAASLDEESTQEMPGRKSKLNEIRMRQSQVQKETWWSELIEKLTEDRRWQVGSAAASVFLVAIIASTYSYITRVPPPPPDPFLNQLLTKKEIAPEAQKELIAEPAAAESTSAPDASAKPIKSAPASNKQRINFMQLIADARFQEAEKNFDNQKSLGATDRALLLELALLSQSESLRAKVSFIIKDATLIAKYPILQRTAALYMVGDLQTRGAGINQLQSLQLTRPRDALVPAYIGIAYKEAKRPDLALQAWGQALTQDQSLAWLQKEKEDLARANGRLDLAKEAALGLSKIAGHESDGFFRLGRLAKLTEDDEAAIKYLQQSVKAKEQITTRLYLAETFVQTKQWDKAQASLEKIPKLSPTPVENRNFYFLGGKIFCGQKKLKEARSMFDRSLSLDANYMKALEAKADCEFSLGDQARASKTFEKLLKKAPQNHLIWLKYGKALRMAEKSNPKAALAAIQRSIDIQPSDRAHLEMAHALRALNRNAEAKQHLREAIELNPRNSEAQKLATELQ